MCTGEEEEERLEQRDFEPLPTSKMGWVFSSLCGASLVAHKVKNPPAMQETQV